MTSWSDIGGILQAVDVQAGDALVDLGSAFGWMVKGGMRGEPADSRDGLRLCAAATLATLGVRVYRPQ